MGGGDGNETGSVTEGKQKSMTGIDASLPPPDFREKEESNNVAS